MSERKRQSLYDVWKYSFQLTSQLSIRGHSRGSERTGFYIPELRLYLDAGVQGLFHPHWIFLTHVHADHSNSLMNNLTGLTTTPQILAPAESIDLIKNCFTSYKHMTSHSPVQIRFQFLPLVAEQRVDVGKCYCVKSYRLFHDVPCLGYGIIKKKTKLKEEYLDKSKQLLKEFRSKGEQIDEISLEHVMIYLCDTNIQICENEEIFLYQYIFIECTFFAPEDIDIAKDKHIHWQQLLPIIEKHPENKFVLIHASIRYKDVHQYCESLPPNVIIWTN